MHERTHDGRAFRLLTLLDEYTRECLAIEVKRQMNHQDVLDLLAELLVDRGVPEYIRSDNGSEFTAQAVRDWLRAVGVRTLYIIHRAGQPLGEWLCGELQRETERRAPQCRDFRHVVGSKGVSREVAKGVQPETASQRLGLSAAGAGGQTNQVASTGFYPLEWTSYVPESNLKGGLVRGGGSVTHKTSPMLD